MQAPFFIELNITIPFCQANTGIENSIAGIEEILLLMTYFVIVEVQKNKCRGFLKALGRLHKKPPQIIDYEAVSYNILLSITNPGFGLM